MPSTYTFREFETAAARTATYPHSGEQTLPALTYVMLGLTGEAGECSDALKKVIRDQNGVLTPDARQHIVAEVSDVLWYVARACAELGVPMGAVALHNVAKLADRAARGVIGGSGDNR